MALKVMMLRYNSQQIFKINIKEGSKNLRMKKHSELTYFNQIVHRTHEQTHLQYFLGLVL